MKTKGQLTHQYKAAVGFQELKVFTRTMLKFLRDNKISMKTTIAVTCNPSSTW